jgi:hypothetical protein
MSAINLFANDYESAAEKEKNACVIEESVKFENLTSGI